MSFFMKAIHVHSIIVLTLEFRVWTVEMIVLAQVVGDGGLAPTDVAINLHNHGDILVEVIGDGFHHMNGMDEVGV
jgi:hypothetical protein